MFRGSTRRRRAALHDHAGSPPAGVPPSVALGAPRCCCLLGGARAPGQVPLRQAWRKPRVLRVCAADACAARARQIVVKEVVQGGSAWRSGMVGLAAAQARLLASCAAAPSPRSPPSAARIELPTGPRRHLTALVVVCRL